MDEEDDYHLVAKWPCGTWCELEVLEEFLGFMSDDYIIEEYDNED